MKLKVMVLAVLLMASAALAAKFVFVVTNIPSCRAPQNFHKAHSWLSKGKLSEREPINSKTPIEDCARRDRYQTCEYCLSTFVTGVEFEGPKCPQEPPRGCQVSAR